MEKIHTSHNIVDMLTKGVTREKLSSFLVLDGIQVGEDEKFTRYKVDHSPTGTITMELL